MLIPMDVRSNLERLFGARRACLGLFAAADELGVGFVSGVAPHVLVDRQSVLQGGADPESGAVGVPWQRAAEAGRERGHHPGVPRCVGASVARGGAGGGDLGKDRRWSSEVNCACQCRCSQRRHRNGTRGEHPKVLTRASVPGLTERRRTPRTVAAFRPWRSWRAEAPRDLEHPKDSRSAPRSQSPDAVPDAAPDAAYSDRERLSEHRSRAHHRRVVHVEV